MNYEKHFDAWTKTMTPYPVLFLDYKNLWDKKTQRQLVSFLEIQPGCVNLFPERKETKKKIDPQVRKKLNDLYGPLNAKIADFTEWFNSE